jgi:hypothetical protein
MDDFLDFGAVNAASRFGLVLGAEVARSERYGHPFAVIILRPPDGSFFSEGLANGHTSENLTALLTRGLVRESDSVSVLAEERAIGVLLPEAGVSGVAALIERLLAAISDREHEWSVDVYFYPEHQNEITELAKRAA